MARTNVRRWLRNLRQAANKASLTPEQLKKYPKECEQFIAFGGKHGKSQGRSFESFLSEANVV